jgi:hypothetical protein
MKNAEYNPTVGGIPATKAKATASGTNAKETVTPDRTSSLTEAVCLEKNCNINTPVEVLD